MYQPVDTTLGDGREVRERNGHEVEHHCHRLTVKVSTAEEITVLEHERVVRGGIELAADHARCEIERVEHRPVHLWHAAKRVCVLHARIAFAVRLANLAVD